MKFKDWTHENFELCNECVSSRSGIAAYHAVLFDREEDLAYFEIIFDDFSRDYDNGGYYPNDLEDFQNNENPKITISRETTKIDDDGEEYFDDNELIFIGTLKDAQKDDRFADLEIKENVRSDYMPCDWATNSQYEKRFSKCKSFENTYSNILKLFNAVDRNDLETISALAKKGLNLKTNISCDGYTPLNVAIKKHHNDIAKFLIANGADIEQVDEYFWSPLRKAAVSNNKEMLKLLIENGADVEYSNRFGWNALHFAIFDAKDLDSVKLLVENGADVNHTADSKTTPLMLSASINNNKILNFLIDNDADVNAQDVNGDTALHRVCEYTKGYFAIAESLINADANLDILNNGGMSALDEAMKWGHYDIAKLLIDCGAEIKSDTLFIACQAGGASRDNTECVKLLIKNGVDVNFKTEYGSTALMNAALGERFETIKLLIENGADVNIQDNSGETALDKTELRLAQRNTLVHKGYAEENQKIKDFLIANGAKTGKELKNDNEESQTIRKRR